MAEPEESEEDNFDPDFEGLARSLEDRYLCQRLDEGIELLGWLNEMLTKRMETPGGYKDLDLPKSLRIVRKRLANYQQREF